jgi:hypothetical protein
MSAGTMAGAWGASTGLGQESAGNARADRVPGNLAWSRTKGQSLGERRGGAPKGERAAISARPCSAEYGHGRCAFSALRLPLFFGGKSFVASVGKTRARLRRENESARTSAPALAGTDEARCRMSDLRQTAATGTGPPCCILPSSTS